MDRTANNLPEKTFFHVPSLNKESFLCDLAANLALVNENSMGPTIASDYITQVGLSMGAAIEEKYRTALHKNDPFTPREYAEIIVDLKNKIGGQFYLLDVNAECVTVGTKVCPIEDLATLSPILCHMTSSVFGGIAARNFGYAKVILKKRISKGESECLVTVYLHENNESKAEAGSEYRHKTPSVSKAIQEDLLLPNILQTLEGLLDTKTQELYRREEKYRLLFDQIPEAVWVYNLKELQFLDVNQTAIDRYGYTKPEYLSMKITDLRPKEDLSSFMDVIHKRKLDKHHCSEGVWRHIKKDGTVIWVEVTSQPIDFEGQEARMVISKDITEKKKSEEEKESLKEQLAQAQKMEALGTLAGGISHDFNNILTGILGYTSFLMMEMNESDPYYHPISTIHNSSIRASELTKQLLGFARKGKYQNRPISLNHVVESIIKIIGHTFDKSIRIQTELDSNLKAIEADTSQIEQSIMNLCINAQNAMPHGGTLNFRTRNVFLTPKDVAQHIDATPGEYVEISVSDTGTGMEKTIQERIFEPFFTTRRGEQGTGLGLAMVYGIVKNHGGIINVFSSPGKGSEFLICLPASNQPYATSSTDRGGNMQKGTEGILVVDDEPDIVHLGKKVLNSLGYEVKGALSGTEACSIYEKNREKINLVILDLLMPEMSGEETFNKLRAINPNVRILLSSGYSQEEQPRTLMEQGIQGFIQKPYVMKDLAKAVRQALDQDN